jgi:toxin CcdB
VTQFTVYRNKNPRSRTTFPFLVNVQSDLLDELQTRVVIPLTRAAALTRKPVGHLMPTVQFEGEAYILMTPQLAGVARSELGPPAGNLAGRRDTIVAAMNFLLSGF